MTSSQTARLLSPEEIAVRAGEQTTFLRLPVAQEVFAARQIRLHELAQGHPMRDYLLLIAEVARAQHDALQSQGPLTLPTEEALQAAARDAMAPLAATAWKRDPAWREVLLALCRDLRARLAPGPLHPVLDQLVNADAEWIEGQANRILDGVLLGLDLATAPLIAAALQVTWTNLVLRTSTRYKDLPHGAFGRIVQPGVCPCCASRPTASITRIGAEQSGQRFAHCSLCSTEWHVVRVKCVRCESTKGIHYESLTPADAGDEVPTPAVQAECCDECGHYLKIVHMERDQRVDPIADDLASILLDLLVAESGKIRHGSNLMLFFGEGDDEVEPGREH